MAVFIATMQRLWGSHGADVAETLIPKVALEVAEALNCYMGFDNDVLRFWSKSIGEEFPSLELERENVVEAAKKLGKLEIVHVK